MISVIICSRDENVLKTVKEQIAQTIGICHEVIAIDNSSGKLGICKAYNHAAAIAKYDYLCFLHEDISFETLGWGNRVIEHLSSTEIGLIGIAGGDTKSIVPSSWPSSIFESEISIIQHFSNSESKKIISTGYPENKSILKRVTCIDGVWMCTRKDVFQQYQFDEVNFTGFHGYDIDYSLQVNQKFKVYVAFDILIHHYSAGSFGTEWVHSSIKVSKKWKNKLPLSCRNLSRQELIRQHWTSFNVFIDKMLELNFSQSFMLYTFFQFSFNRFFHLMHFGHGIKKILLKRKSDISY